MAVFGLLPSYTSTLALPSITTQPADQTVNAGQSARINLAWRRRLGLPLSYQWQSNGSNIGGATFSSYTTPITTASDAELRFSVVVSDIAGSTTSSAATLTVNLLPGSQRPQYGGAAGAQ